MATGEKRFSVRGVKVTKYDNSPFPAGKYKLVVGPGWEVKAPGDGSKSGLQYVNGYFLVPGVKEGRRLYHMFFVDLTEGSDGATMVTRGGGLVEFAQGMGLDDIPVGIITLKRSSGDRKGEDASCLNPKSIATWLNGLEGTEVEAQVKVQKGTGGYADKNVVEFFIESEGASEDEDDAGIDDEEGDELDEADEDEADESEEVDEENDADDDDDIDEEEEKPAPKKKVMKKAAPAPAKKSKR